MTSYLVEYFFIFKGKMIDNFCYILYQCRMKLMKRMIKDIAMDKDMTQHLGITSYHQKKLWLKDLMFWCVKMLAILENINKVI